MTRLPKVLASSVIRSAHQGQSHGGLYLVNLEEGSSRQVLDWNNQSIRWEGRGGDRGLRGISFYKNRIYLAASNEVFVYDNNFNFVTSYHNRYLKHCHEIFIQEHLLYITSTGFDSILLFDLQTEKFIKGYMLRYDKADKKMHFSIFDPKSDNGPLPGDTIHINNVYFQQKALFIGSLVLKHLVYIKDDRVYKYAPIPQGTHNARPMPSGVILNATAHGRVAYLGLDGRAHQSFPIVRYAAEKLKMNNLPLDHARQGFGRGLCVTPDGLIIGGSSPATVSVYKVGRAQTLKSVNLTMDVRNAIHGLEIWPF